MKTSESILAELGQPIDVNRVKQRKGASDKMLSYIEAYDAIDTANRIFGFEGWSHTVRNIVRYPENKMFTAQVDVTARIGERVVVHGDVGVGIHKSDKQEEIEKAVKEAASDGIKRALRAFGAQFGNELYDKLAPEHNGHQRPTEEAITAYMALRIEAIQLGIKAKDGTSNLWHPNDQTTAEQLKAVFDAITERVEKRRAANAEPQADAQTSEPQDAPVDDAEMREAMST
jgi:DNA recombination protein Rad52